MGLYTRLIFPRLCDWAMSTPEFTQLRKNVLADASGEILEIGFGTGLNLGNYPEQVALACCRRSCAAMTRIAQADRKEPHRCRPSESECRIVAL